MNSLRILGASFALLALAQAGMAEPITIGETSTLFSKNLNEERTLMISLPVGYQQGEKGYPVVYLIDAETRFHHTTTNLAALARIGQIPEMIVVGLTNTERTRDLTPVWTKADPPADRKDIAAGGGGADNFLAFLRQELIPHVETSYRTVPFRILIGHSLGGLFGVHAFVSDPELFQAILAISPSLWWDEGKSVERAAAVFRERPDLAGHLYLTLGSEGEEMLSNFQAMETLLRYRAPQGLHWQTEILIEENHGSVPMPSVDRGLKFFFPRWRIPNFALGEGLAAVDRHYAELVEEYGFSISTPERLINNLGYAALQEQEIEKAIEIFRTNTERHPESANVYDSLGEALERAGQFPQARELYTRAWKMGKKLDDPNTGAYKQHLDALSATSEGPK